MKLVRLFGFFLFASSACGFEVEEFVDRLDSALTVSALQDTFRARLSGTTDFEFYHFQQPPPGLINSSIDNLFNPRLTLFLDIQLGPQFYFFSQARVDRGFDPSNHGAAARLDEYALRVTPWEDGRFTLQIGKFATIVGNFVPRHLSWENPCINSPLLYENVTPVSDKAAPRSQRMFITGFEPADKYQFNPVIWGPSYSSGISVSGRLGEFDYAAEMKNSSLSSRPESWSVTETSFEHPSFNARLGLRPNQAWNFGISISEGTYFRSEAQRTLPRGRDIDDYRELLLAQDVSFAWHHLQLWAEFYETRFEVPRVGDADTFAYYVEGKYKITAQLFAALRWNQQLFGTVPDGSGSNVRWGRNLGRADVALGYRFTPHTQLKLQYSFQRETAGSSNHDHLLAAQFTVRF